MGTEKGKILPSKLDLGSDLKQIEQNWDNYIIKRDIENKLPILLRNRSALPLLNLECSLFICQILYSKNIYSRIAFTLDIICRFDWRNKLESLLNQKIHPFRFVEKISTNEKRKLTLQEPDYSNKSSKIIF